MKKNRENYVKPLSYVIETGQPLMYGGSNVINIGVSDKTENKSGPCGVRRYEDYEDYEEEDDWNQ